MPRRTDEPLPDIPRFPWEYFYEWFRWSPDQSVSIVGGIGSGKSTLELAILPKQNSVVFFGTKPRDPIYGELQAQGYRHLDSWPKPTPMTKFPNPGPHVLLQPPVKNLNEDIARQRTVFGGAMERIFLSGGQDPAPENAHPGARVVVFDEVRYITQNLKLTKLYTTLILQGRAMHIPVVAGSQRASWVPRETWSEATHIFMFASRDRRDLLTLRELGGRVDPDVIIAAIMSLEPDNHECLYINRISGRLAITTAPKAV